MHYSSLSALALALTVAGSLPAIVHGIWEGDGNGNVVCRLSADKSYVVCEGTRYQVVVSEFDEPGTFSFYWHILSAVLLVLIAGAMFGLLVGLLSLNPDNVEAMTTGSDARMRKSAAKLLPLVRRRQLLLLTLLLAAFTAAETLPVVLSWLVPYSIAIAISVCSMVIFGEIIPQTLYSRYGLGIAANFMTVIWLFVALFFIIAYPLSKFLDSLLGTKYVLFYRRGEATDSEDQAPIVQSLQPADDTKTTEVLDGASVLSVDAGDLALLASDLVQLDIAALQQALGNSNSNSVVNSNTRDSSVSGP